MRIFLGLFFIGFLCPTKAISSTDSEIAIHVDIPSQPLAQALITFSLKYHRFIAAKSELLQGIKSESVLGKYSPNDALIKILSGTKFTITTNNRNGYIITPEEITSELTTLNSFVYEPSQEEELHVTGYGNELMRHANSVTSNAIEQEDIQNYKIDDISRLSAKVPSVFFSPSDGGVSHINIRGMADLTFNSRGVSPTPIYHDFVYLSATEANRISLFDMERIDIFSGPHSVHNGHSATGGSIYLHSKSPSLHTFEISAELTRGNYNLNTFQAKANIPIGNKLAVRVAGYDENRDSYSHHVDDYSFLYDEQQWDLMSPQIDFSSIAKPTISNQDGSNKSAVRLTGIYQFNDKNKALLKIETHKNFSLPSVVMDPYIVNNFGRKIVIDTDTQYVSKNTITSLNSQHKISGMTLNIRAFRSDFEGFEIEDFDSGLLPKFIEIREQHSTKRHGGNIELFNRRQSSITWMIGSQFEKDQNILHTEADIISFGVDSTFEETGITIFNGTYSNHYRNLYGKINVNLYDALTLSTGGKYTNHNSKLGDSGLVVCNDNIEGPTETNIIDLIDNRTSISSYEALPEGKCHIFKDQSFGKRWETFDYLVGLDLTIQKNIRINALTSTAHSSGLLINNNVIPSQSSKNVEIGVHVDSKYSSRFNAKLFYTKHKNVIQGPDFADFNANAKGLEVVYNYRSKNGHDLTFSGAYIETRIESYELRDTVTPLATFNPEVSDALRAEQGYKDLSGNKLRGTPTNSLSIRYKKELRVNSGLITPVISVNYIGKHFLDEFNRTEAYISSNTIESDNIENSQVLARNISLQPSHTNVDLIVNWKSPSNFFGASIGVYNATNQNVRTALRDTALGLEGQTSLYAPPRTIVIRFSLFL